MWCFLSRPLRPITMIFLRFVGLALWYPFTHLIYKACPSRDERALLAAYTLHVTSRSVHSIHIYLTGELKTNRLGVDWSFLGDIVLKAVVYFCLLISLRCAVCLVQVCTFSSFSVMQSPISSIYSSYRLTMYSCSASIISPFTRVCVYPWVVEWLLRRNLLPTMQLRQYLVGCYM